MIVPIEAPYVKPNDEVRQVIANFESKLKVGWRKNLVPYAASPAT